MNSAQVENADVLLFQGTAPHSRLIEEYTGSQYSHAGLALCAGPDGELCCLEALEGHGVRLYPMKKYLPECSASGCQVDVFQPRQREPRKLAMALGFALAQVGNRYDAGQLVWSFGKVSSILRKIFGLQSRLHPRRWFCSELVAASYEKAGYSIPQKPELTTPGDIAKFPFLNYGGRLTPGRGSEVLSLIVAGLLMLFGVLGNAQAQPAPQFAPPYEWTPVVQQPGVQIPGFS